MTIRRLVEVARWRVRLWLVDYRERVKIREADLTAKYLTYGWPFRWLRDLVDRLSPFEQRGYRRSFVRRLLWRIAHPVAVLRLNSLRWSLHLLARVTEYTGPGRFEAISPRSDRVKAEWLNDHRESSDRDFGNFDIYPLASWLYREIEVPWSLTAENWIIEKDEMGFIYAEQFASVVDADVAFSGAEYRFDLAVELDLSGDREDEDGPPPDLNREGDPTLNGAFGG